MKRLLLVLASLLLILTSGCNYREIDRGYLVTSIGFVNENSSATIYMEAISSSGAPDKPSERVVLTGTGYGFENAYKDLKFNVVKPIYFEQLGSAVFEEGTLKSGIDFFKTISNINYGIYLVKTDDVKLLFEWESPSGVLGYDIIGLIKTNNDKTSQLYQTNREEFNLPTVKLINGKLVFKASGDDI